MERSQAESRGAVSEPKPPQLKETAVTESLGSS